MKPFPSTIKWGFFHTKYFVLSVISHRYSLDINQLLGFKRVGEQLWRPVHAKDNKSSVSRNQNLSRKCHTKACPCQNMRLYLWAVWESGMSKWVIEFNGLFWDSGHRYQCSPYKLCNDNLYIGITSFLQVDNTQSTGHNELEEKKMNKNQAHKKVMAPIKSGLLNIMYQWTVEYHVSANNKNWYDQILVFDTWGSQCKRLRCSWWMVPSVFQHNAIAYCYLILPYLLFWNTLK